MTPVLLTLLSKAIPRRDLTLLKSQNIPIYNTFKEGYNYAND